MSNIEPYVSNSKSQKTQKNNSFSEVLSRYYPLEPVKTCEWMKKYVATLLYYVGSVGVTVFSFFKKLID